MAMSVSISNEKTLKKYLALIDIAIASYRYDWTIARTNKSLSIAILMFHCLGMLVHQFSAVSCRQCPVPPRLTRSPNNPPTVHLTCFTIAYFSRLFMRIRNLQCKEAFLCWTVDRLLLKECRFEALIESLAARGVVETMSPVETTSSKIAEPAGRRQDSIECINHDRSGYLPGSHVSYRRSLLPL